MLGPYKRYRYRNQVRQWIDSIWEPVKPNMSRRVLIVAFGALKWRRPLRTMQENGTPPMETAIITTCFCLENLISQSEKDRREITLYAIRTRNASNHEANNYLAVAEQIERLGASRVHILTTVYTIVGALEGRFGEDLVDYRQGRLLNDVLDNPSDWSNA